MNIVMSKKGMRNFNYFNIRMLAILQLLQTKRDEQSFKNPRARNLIKKSIPNIEIGNIQAV